MYSTGWMSDDNWLSSLHSWPCIQASFPVFCTGASRSGGSCRGCWSTLPQATQTEMRYSVTRRASSTNERDASRMKPSRQTSFTNKKKNIQKSSNSAVIKLHIKSNTGSYRKALGFARGSFWFRYL